MAVRKGAEGVWRWCDGKSFESLAAVAECSRPHDHELDLYSPSGKRLHLELDEPFAIYSRIAFDCLLARSRARRGRAGHFGKDLGKKSKEDGSRLATEERNRIEWTGSMLVGADGANSGIAKMLAGKLAAFGHGSRFWLSRAAAGERSPRRQ